MKSEKLPILSDGFKKAVVRKRNENSTSPNRAIDSVGLTSVAAFSKAKEANFYRVRHGAMALGGAPG